MLFLPTVRHDLRILGAMDADGRKRRPGSNLTALFRIRRRTIGSGVGRAGRLARLPGLEGPLLQPGRFGIQAAPAGHGYHVPIRAWLLPHSYRMTANGSGRCG